MDSRIDGLTAYTVPRATAPVDLRLDGNEGAVPPLDLVDAITVDTLRDYPDTGPLERSLAERLGVTADRVVVTAGADDALDRMCRALLPGRALVLPVPGFEMVRRYATLAGGTVHEVPWPRGPYPTDAVIAAADGAAVIVVTHPNNPTGAVATAADLERLAAETPGVLKLVDLAYVEFADEDLTATALSLPDTLVVRTLSKAWGLAGARVGYAAGPEQVVRWLRAAGAPYAVTGPSLAMAGALLERGEAAMTAFVGRIREERAMLTAMLTDLGADPIPSQANFVLFRAADPLWMRDAMAGLGIAVRAFPGRPGLERRVRVALPGGDAYDRLAAALSSVLAPQALLLDMDGVIADVSGSFREAIVQTCARFGVRVDREAISAAKQAGDANDDWSLTWRLVREGGGQATLAEVTRVFDDLYQGGLYRRERLLVDAAALDMPVGIVTGRPRADADRFLRDHGLDVEVVVCREDGPAKPDPFPVREAMRRLGVERAWMVGDTVDDIRSARAAGVVPIGVVAPGDDPERTGRALVAAGAARVFPDLTAALEVWP